MDLTLAPLTKRFCSFCQVIGFFSDYYYYFFAHVPAPLCSDWPLGKEQPPHWSPPLKSLPLSRPESVKSFWGGGTEWGYRAEDCVAGQLHVGPARPLVSDHKSSFYPQVKAVL